MCLILMLAMRSHMSASDHYFFMVAGKHHVLFPCDSSGLLITFGGSQEVFCGGLLEAVKGAYVERNTVERMLSATQC